MFIGSRDWGVDIVGGDIILLPPPILCLLWVHSRESPSGRPTMHSSLPHGLAVGRQRTISSCLREGGFYSRRLKQCVRSRSVCCKGRDEVASACTHFPACRAPPHAPRSGAVHLPTPWPRSWTACTRACWSFSVPERVPSPWCPYGAPGPPAAPCPHCRSVTRVPRTARRTTVSALCNRWLPSVVSTASSYTTRASGTLGAHPSDDDGRRANPVLPLGFTRKPGKPAGAQGSVAAASLC